ncbi:MAG: hypothetical protein LBF08_00845 [Dysgonamonadaceae bacterium]|nr:hypothetical protein [Dysgonamonadaceae bacterium]
MNKYCLRQLSKASRRRQGVFDSRQKFPEDVRTFLTAVESFPKASGRFRRLSKVSRRRQDVFDSCRKCPEDVRTFLTAVESVPKMSGRFRQPPQTQNYRSRHY